MDHEINKPPGLKLRIYSILYEELEHKCKQNVIVTEICQTILQYTLWLLCGFRIYDVPRKQMSFVVCVCRKLFIPPGYDNLSQHRRYTSTQISVQHTQKASAYIINALCVTAIKELLACA